MNKLFKNFLENPFREDRLIVVDGMRGLAILTLFIYHIDQQKFQYLVYAMDVFFALSGFVIGHITYQRIKKNQFFVKEFLINRMLKIYLPTSFVVLLVGLFSYYIYSPLQFEGLLPLVWYANTLRSHIFYSTHFDYFQGDSFFNPLIHIWSITIEEWFYLIWIAFVALCLKFKLGINSKIWLISTLAVSFLIYFFMTKLNSSDSVQHFSVSLRMSEIFLGAAVAYYFNKNNFINLLKNKVFFLTNNIFLRLSYTALWIYLIHAVVFSFYKYLNSSASVSYAFSIMTFFGLFILAQYLEKIKIIIFQKIKTSKNLNLIITVLLGLNLFFSYFFLSSSNYLKTVKILSYLKGFDFYELYKQPQNQCRQDAENKICYIGNSIYLKAKPSNRHLWLGDSMALSMPAFLDKVSAKTQVNFDLVAKRGCMLFQSKDSRCQQLESYLMNQSTNYHKIFIHMAWSKLDKSYDLEEWLQKLKNKTKELKSEIILVGNWPICEPMDQYLKKRFVFLKSNEQLKLDRARIADQCRQSETKFEVEFKKSVVEKGFKYLSIFEFENGTKNKWPFIAGDSSYIDTSHISDFAADLIAQEMIANQYNLSVFN